MYTYTIIKSTLAINCQYSGVTIDSKAVMKPIITNKDRTGLEEGVKYSCTGFCACMGLSHLIYQFHITIKKELPNKVFRRTNYKCSTFHILLFFAYKEYGGRTAFALISLQLGWLHH